MRVAARDLVLCINAKNHVLVKGKVYTVLSFDSCAHCGELVLDVGLWLDTLCDSHFAENACQIQKPTILVFTALMLLDLLKSMTC
jgi:hypothetical protein